MVPQLAPTALQVVGLQPQRLSTPAPPHVAGGVHAPQSMRPPQPSAMLPQSLPCAPQLAGRQPH
jgi:hypothetical protein